MTIGKEVDHFDLVADGPRDFRHRFVVSILLLRMHTPDQYEKALGHLPINHWSLKIWLVETHSLQLK